MLTEAEAGLLLTCARQSLPNELARRAIEILCDGGLRWPYMIDEASRHGVAPLFFRHVESFQQRAQVSAEPMHRLRQAFVRSAFRTRVHEEAIAQLIPRFHEAGVDPVLLKGAGLSRTVYRESTARPFADIDLLVAADKIDNAKDALFRCGYSLAPELLSERFNRDYHINLPFVRREPVPVHIELHWKPTDRFSLIAFDECAMLSRARSVSFGNVNASVLDPADELVYLAAHLDNHGYVNRAVVDRSARQFLLHPLSGNRLIWFTDLHELISTGPDWKNVIARAKKARASAALAVSLHLTNELLGTPIDPAVLDELPVPRTSWLRRKLSRHVQSLAKSSSNAGASASSNFQRRFLSTQKGFELRLVRLIDIWQYIFPPPKAIARSYAAHIFNAGRHCAVMFVELGWHRIHRSGPTAR